MDIFEKSMVDAAAFGRFLLDRFPVFAFVDLKGDINVAVFGESETRMDFFKMIASCCHMVDKKLTITLADPTAYDFMRKFLDENPMAKTTFFVQVLCLDGDNKVISHKLDQEAASEPLVYVNVVADGLDSLEKISVIDKMAYPDLSGSLFSYSWVIGADSGQNTRTGALLEKYLDQADFFKKGRQRSFVGELNLGKEQTIVRMGTKQRITHILVNVDMTKDEVGVFEKGLLEKAFRVHRFYAKEYNSRQDIQSMREDFSRAYAKASSVRSAISIPYKIASVIPYASKGNGKKKGKDEAQDLSKNGVPGVKGISREAVREFAQIVSGEKNQDNGREKLVYLEHKSWMAWLICNGWQRVSVEDVKDYAFVGENDFKDKKNKRHPCLVECRKEGMMYLDDPGSKIRWYKSYLEKIKDPLDKVSLELYLYAKERTQDLCAEGGEAGERLEKLTDSMHNYLGENAGQRADEAYEYIHNLENAFHKLAEEERNAINNFEKCANDFRRKFAEDFAKSQRLESAFKDVISIADIAKEAARKRSYKRSDLTLLLAIPYIINSNIAPCIYKLEIKEKPWENMYSTVLIEPQKTVILCDDSDSEVSKKEQRKYKDVLEGMGLGHISCVAMGIRTAMKKLSKKITENDIVDITDAEPSFVYKVKSMPEFSNCQFIVIRDGEVVNLTQEEGQGYLYPVQKSLTVGEMLRLSDVYYYTERDANTLASFANAYRDIWKLYFDVCEPREWKRLCAFFWYADQKNYKMITQTSAGTAKAQKAEPILLEEVKVSSKVLVRETNPIPLKALESSNVKNVLNDLKGAGWIESYHIPKNVRNIRIEIKTKCEPIMEAVNWMLDRAQQSWDNNLKYVERRIRGGKTAGCLYDDVDKLCLQEKEDIPQKDSFGMENEFGECAYQEIRGVIEKLAREDQKKCMLEEADTGHGITVTLKNTDVKRLMEREGNALEQYTYFTMRNQGFDDVKLSVSLAFAAPDEFQDPDTDITNEIDVIATKGMESYFVSCKQSWAQKEYLTEIRYFAEHLGVRGKAILVCSNKNERAFQTVRQRADIMGVYFITRTVIKEGKLGEAFQRILDGADVKEINHMCGL